MYTLINTLEDLAFLNEELIQKPYIGVDTEFRRTTKDNMRLSLLQINDNEEIYLIDAISIQSPGDSCDFLFSNSVTKIFHSCREDLEAIYSWTKRELRNIFDTQLADALLDGEFSISYQSLVEKRLGIVLDKNETRSNWIRRPLSESQLKYAALDVEYLNHLYIEQNNELVKSGKLDWLQEDIKKIISNTFTELDLSIDLLRTLTRVEENELLRSFNTMIEDIAREEKINKTLFFSKKAQKEFLRLTIRHDIDFACDLITKWRSNLVKGSVSELLK